MRALQYIAPKTLQIVDIETPNIKEDEVLLKIKKVGICGTDLHIYRGDMKTPLPLIMGHEFVGDIAEIGSKVRGFKIKDKVVGEHVIGCAECIYCKIGRKELCNKLTIIGLDRPGALAEYLAIPANLLFKVNELTYDEAVLVEPLSIAQYAVEKSGVKANQQAVVIGQGPIGIFLDEVLKAKSVKNIGIDIIESRLLFVEKNNFVNAAINSKLQTDEEIVAKYLNGIGADYIFEAVGLEKTMQTAINIAKKGGKIMLIGIFKDKVNIDLTKVEKAELSIEGSWACTNSFTQTIKMITSKEIKTESLITHRYPFEKAIYAFEDSEKYSDNRIKTVIEF